MLDRLLLRLLTTPLLLEPLGETLCGRGLLGLDDGPPSLSRSRDGRRSLHIYSGPKASGYARSNKSCPLLLLLNRHPTIFSPRLPLLCWRVGEVTLRMQGVSWPSLSCEESLERSLERRRSRECSQPPLAPCRLIFLCWTSTRDARAWLLRSETQESTFLCCSGQRTVLWWSFVHFQIISRESCFPTVYI